MKYIEYKEHRRHGTRNFPFAIYHLSESHPRYHMIDHWHTEAEILRILSGSFTLLLDGTIYNLQEGDVLFISPGSLHGGTPSDCEYECLVFNIDFLFAGNQSSMDQLHSFLSHETTIRPLLPQQTADLTHDIQELFTMMAGRPTGYQLMVQGYLCLILGKLFHHGFFQHSPLPDHQRKRLRRLRRILNYIHEHYADSLTLQDLADFADMNCNYFCRFFKNLMKKTPIDYLNYYRVECACEKLLFSDASITQIAMDCGFNDVSYFVKVFKKYKHTTPSRFLS